MGVEWATFPGRRTLAVSEADRTRFRHVPQRLQGEALWKALGYANAKAFQRARARGEVSIPLYPVPGQSRGVFAKREDVERWRAEHRPEDQSDKEGAAMS